MKGSSCSDHTHNLSSHPTSESTDGTTSKIMQQVRTSTAQASGQNTRIELMNKGALRQEVRNLNDLLAQTRTELSRQKSLKKMFINREKETKRELERLQRYSDPETLSKAKIATQVRNTLKRKKKKLLQVDYEELQVAHIIATEKSTTGFQVEESKNKLLQEELERLRVSHHELSLKYETDLSGARRQVEDLQNQLEQAIKSHSEKVMEDWHLIQSLRAERDTLYQKAMQEITALQNQALEREKLLCVQMEELKLNGQISLNAELSIRLGAKSESFRLPKRKRIRFEDLNKSNQEGSLDDAQACKSTEEAVLVTPASPEMSSHQNPCVMDRESQQATSKLDVSPPRGPTRVALEQSSSQEVAEVNEAVIELLETDDLTTEMPESSMGNPETTPKKSVWKRTRHMLGLRKPKAWKK